MQSSRVRRLVPSWGGSAASEWIAVAPCQGGICHSTLSATQEARPSWDDAVEFVNADLELCDPCGFPCEMMENCIKYVPQDQGSSLPWAIGTQTKCCSGVCQDGWCAVRPLGKDCDVDSACGTLYCLPGRCACVGLGESCALDKRCCTEVCSTHGKCTCLPSMLLLSCSPKKPGQGAAVRAPPMNRPGAPQDL